MYSATRARLVPVVLALVLTAAAATPAAANTIVLSDVQVDLDLPSLTATVSSNLLAVVDTGPFVSLDGLSVSLEREGVSLDLVSGPTTLDDLPFFLNTPPTMAHGEALSAVVLFTLAGLQPGAYTGAFYFIEAGLPLQVPPQAFAFTVPAVAPVPEPATILLIGAGAVAAGIRRRRTSA